MSQQEEGIVVGIDGDIAKVQAAKHGDCKNCGACPGGNAMVVDTLNLIGAKSGQFVKFEIKEENLLKAAFVMYVLPLVAAAVGAIAGNSIAENLSKNNTLYSILGGVLVFGLSLLYVRYYDKKSKDNRNLPVITEIVEQ